MAEGSTQMRRAQDVQLSMLPDAPQIAGLEIASSYRACDMLGGDFFDFITVDAWRLGFVIADVSGHGAAAALVMAAAKKSLQFCGKGKHSPRETLLAVNEALQGDIPRGMFLSALYGVLDIRTRRFCFASAGHNPPLLVRGGRVKHTWTHPNAPVLGVLPSHLLKQKLNDELVQLQPDDSVIFYTDGLTEANNPQRAMYGEERLVHILNGLRPLPATQMVDGLKRDVDNFRRGAALSDDETILALRIGPPPADPRPLMAEDGQSKSRLPSYRNTLLGRIPEVAEVQKALLAPDSPLVTVTGPAGVGKTRVAIAAADAAAGQFPGGVRYVDLRSARAVPDVCRCVADALKMGRDEARVGLRIGMVLKSYSNNCLLVLDNVEACAEAVTRCVQEWRPMAPNARFLVTSRLALETQPQKTVAIKPLSAPRPADALKKAGYVLADSPAIELFAQRAREIDPRFALTPENTRLVADICYRLDGIPLAIELAAGQVGLLNLPQLAQRLDQRLELFRGQGDAAGRSLEGSLASSWELLDEPERQALMLCSEFAEGFQLELVELLLKHSARQASEVVRSLLRHNLLHYDRAQELEGEHRFRLFESVRLYAQKMLEASGRAAAVRAHTQRALVEYALRWWFMEQEGATPLARRRLKLEHTGLLWLAQTGLDAEVRAWAAVMVAGTLDSRGERTLALELLTAAKSSAPPGKALDWVILQEASLLAPSKPAEVEAALAGLVLEGAQLLSAINTRSLALQALGRSREAIEWVERGLAQPGAGPLRKANLQDRLGNLFGHTGRSQEALQHFQSALQVAREYGDSAMEGRVLYNMSWLAQRNADYENAQRLQSEALRVAQMHEDRALESMVLSSLALSLHMKGEKDQAEKAMQRALRMSREQGNTQLEAQHLNSLARILFEQGRKQEALEAVTASRDLARSIGAKRSEAVAEGNMAAIRIELGEARDAMQSLERAYRMCLELEDKRTALGTLSNIGEVHARKWFEKKDRRALKSAITTLNEACTERRELGMEPLFGGELTLARCLVDFGRQQDAREWLRKAIEDSGRRADDAAKKICAEAKDVLARLDAPPAVGPRRRRTGSGPSLPGIMRPRGAVPRKRRPRLP
ncbi:MAG: SpoIIE family protein phosphatase [Planctomycetes bacterium]|nr:SpoIIE family protein phosphatase [Planctomycetota bacterium]